MFKTDTFRLIKKTFNRFSSLLVIVLIGVAFMMGLMSTPTIMRNSMDIYNDEYNFQDIQLYSQYGFSDKDISVLSKSGVIEDIEASRQIDAYCRRGDGEQVVARLLETDPVINKYKIVEGRAPVAEDECLVLCTTMSLSDYEIGDKVSFYLDKGDDITESLTVTEYTIVGICECPAYSSNMMGTSNLNNLSLSVVFYVPEDNFTADYYTTVFITLEGAKDYTSYTQEYKDYVAAQMEELDLVIDIQQDYRKDEILSEYTQQIEDGRAELEKQKAEGQAQLDAAKQQLDDAAQQIEEGESELSKYSSLVDTAYSEYNDKKNDLTRRKAENDKKIEAIETRSKYIFDDVISIVALDLAEYKSNESVYVAADDRLNALYEDKEELDAQIKASSTNSASYVALLLKQELLDLDITNTTKYINSECKALKEKNAEIDAFYKGIGFEGVEDASAQITLIVAESTAIENSYDALKDIDTGVTTALLTYKQQETALETGKQQYEEGLAEYEKQLKYFNTAIEEAEIELKQAEQALSELPDAEWIVLDRDSQYASYMYEATCKQMTAICFAMPVLFYLVAALVCLTTMTRLVDEQRGQIGIYVALGFSKKAIEGKYISYAILACLIGSAIGIVIGQFLFPTVIYNTWRLMYSLPEMKMQFPIQFILICLAAFVVLMVVVTYCVVRKSVNESAASLMRPKAPKESKEIFLQKFTVLWNHMNFTSKVTARNLIRYKARFFMTVIGIAGCTALLVVGWGIKDSIKDVVNIQFNDIYNYSYIVNLEDSDYTESVTDALSTASGVEDYAAYMTYTTKIYFEEDDDTITVSVYNAADCNRMIDFRSTDHETKLKLKDYGVLVSEKFAKNHGIEVGDYLTIESANGIKQEVYVSGICEMYVMHHLYMSDVYYESVFDENVYKKEVAVKAESHEAADAAVAKEDGVISVSDLDDSADTFNTMIQALDLIILVIIITAGSLALVVLINLTQVNISERIREIATLKVLGFNNKEVNSYIFKEIALLSFIGAVIGLPLGVAEHHFIMSIIDMDMIMFGMNIKTISFIYAFLVTMIFTVLVLFFTRKPLRKVDMIESLKSVE